MEKICSLCQQSLPKEAFAKKGDGLQARCRKCHSIYTREHYRKNKQYYVDKAYRNGNKYKETIDEYKSSNPCIDCGNFYPPECMDFDHIKGEKRFNISARRSWGLSPSVLEEIDKCELVCANCHRIRTKGRKK